MELDISDMRAFVGTMMAKFSFEPDIILSLINVRMSSDLPIDVGPE